MGARTGRSIVLMATAAVVAACSSPINGSGLMAPYAPAPIATQAATPVPLTTADLLAVSPDAGLIAAWDNGQVCVRPGTAASGGVCTGSALPVALGRAAPPNLTVQFAPDSAELAIGVAIKGAGPGSVWLMRTANGQVRPVPAVAGVAPRPPVSPRATPARTPESAPSTPRTSRPSVTGIDPYRSGAAYQAMAWNVSTGHLMLVNLLISDAGPVSRVVDVDPQTVFPRILANISGSHQALSGYVATGGQVLVAGVFREGQIPPDLVVGELGTGSNRNLGPVLPLDTAARPLAVSPDGRRAVVGGDTIDPTGPPVQVDLRTGRRSALPGLTGNFALACYSPDGSQIVTLSSGTDGAARLAVSPADGSGTSRVLASTTGSVDAGGRLSWSPLNVVAVTGSQGGLRLGAVAWLLRP